VHGVQRGLLVTGDRVRDADQPGEPLPVDGFDRREVVVRCGHTS
jgi:hypothetical protein